MSEEKLSLTKRSALLAKSAKATLRADKDLLVFPVLSSIFGVVMFVALALTVFFSGKSTGSLFQEGFDWQSNPWIAIPAFIVSYILATFVAHYCEAAVYTGAMQRFKGGDPTVSSSLAAVNKKIRPLLLFSLMMSTVGIVLTFLENRVPFAGKIAIWLFNAAWSIANVFAVPYIVSSKQDITPIAATKQSASLIKKVWGENVVASFSVGIIGLWWLLGSAIVSGIIGAVLTSLQAAPAIAVALPISLFILSALVVLTIVGALVTIVKAAVFYYAMTGESPEGFSKSVLRATLTPKKSKKVFQF